MIIVNCAQFLEHIKIGTVFWYLCARDGEYSLHGPNPDFSQKVGASGL
jgi:hypothetical protein